MSFVEKLKVFRDKKLEELDDAANKKKIEEFRKYLTALFESNVDKIQTAFTHYITGKPKDRRPAITKEFNIPTEYNNGLQLFFTQENGRHLKEFINEITKTTFTGVHITIKNIVKSSIQLEYKLIARFEINFTENI